ncbi:MAG: hypothetical protein U9Q83_04810 [Bacteroidota bacterium]|nr:hypothetical protein [Bacteroidota bacterium]
MSFENQNNTEQFEIKGFPDKETEQLFSDLKDDEKNPDLYNFAQELNKDIQKSPVITNKEQRKNDLVAGISIMRNDEISKNPELKILAKQILLKIDNIPQSFFASKTKN